MITGTIRPNIKDCKGLKVGVLENQTDAFDMLYEASQLGLITHDEYKKHTRHLLTAGSMDLRKWVQDFGGKLADAVAEAVAEATEAEATEAEATEAEPSV